MLRVVGHRARSTAVSDEIYNARLDVLAAAVRALAGILGPEQATAATLTLRRELEPIVSGKADVVASAEIAAVLRTLGAVGFRKRS